ncbi:unnamed protein product [Darwinula stevensoni]|uniref:Uncharacterized protein n=1 Tax=Darwinula stevensoni TaxID=69355 RepID=A0A7R8XLQ8_9CRUS|nr:unnamed protein product [Darwinula stevensoni]CAG0894555.1 unnamed protein product [Darwinula stevensoni]
MISESPVEKRGLGEDEDLSHEDLSRCNSGDSEKGGAGGRGRRRRRKRTGSSMCVTNFHDAYRLTGEILGEGAYASVQSCVSQLSGQEYAVKVGVFFFCFVSNSLESKKGGPGGRVGGASTSRHVNVADASR